MADIKISELLPASTPLDGTETLPIVQAGNTVKASTQDIASLYSLGYTAEDAANKSTDSSFAGATDLRYPSQLAVKTYVDNTLGNAGWGLNGNSGTTSVNFIGTTNAQDLVIKTNGVERLRVDGTSAYGYFKGNLFAINGTNNTQIGAYQNNGGITKGVILNNYTTGGEVQIFPGNATNSLTLKAPTLSANKILTFPNTNGTLVASVNNVTPDAAGNVTLSISGGWSLTGNSGTTAGTNFIGTTDDVDFVIKRNNLTRFKVTTPSSGAYQSLIGVGGLTIYSSAYDAGFTYPLVELEPDQERINIKNFAGKTVSIYANQITDTRSLSLPDKSGTLATEDYLVYTALIDANSGSPIATVLKNTLGVNINWTNPFNGQIRGTASSGNPFTISKTWISSGSYDNAGQPYFVTSQRMNDTQVRLKFYLYDGTITATPNFISYSVEIRVYP